MERQSGNLATRVVHVGSHGGETRHTGQGDDMTVIVADHGGQKRLDQGEMGDGIDLEGPTDAFHAPTQDGSPRDDSGIVDEDGGVADFPLDGFGGGFDGGSIGDVDRVVPNTGGKWGGWRTKIEDDDFDAPRCELTDHQFAEATTAARDQDDFLPPIPFVAGEVVEGGAVEAAVDLLRDPYRDEKFQGLDEGGEFDSVADHVLERLFGFFRRPGCGEEDCAGDDGLEEDLLDGSGEIFECDTLGGWTEILYQGHCLLLLSSSSVFFFLLYAVE